MNQDNPYQAPKEIGWEQEDSAGGEFYPATKCPNCNADVTFGMALKQPTPFRLKCSCCGCKYRLQTPFMRLIAVAVSPGVILLPSMPLLGALWLGFWSLCFSIPILIAAWLALEWATYRYILRRGRFTPLSARSGAFSSTERASAGKLAKD